MQKKIDTRILFQEFYPCPLIKSDIDRGLCYDIQSVRGKMMKKDSLVPDFDPALADKLCESCPYCQMQ
ncbi:MAG: hypothetical protein FWH08_02440 [Oscillospiraceae bacterium]|nr:hypothetical protein [Oscillospiraceae bacterium]